jgi:hypothetical protein
MKSTQIENAARDRNPKAEAKKRQPFVEPKLTFVEPRLVKHGSVEKITAGFFGTFYP